MPNLRQVKPLRLICPATDLQGGDNRETLRDQYPDEWLVFGCASRSPDKITGVFPEQMIHNPTDVASLSAR